MVTLALIASVLISEPADVSVKYPTWRTKTRAAAEANQIARAREATILRGFTKEKREGDAELKKMGSAARFSILVKPYVTRDSAALCSGYVVRYEFTGGAHGNTSFESINVGWDGKRVSLTDFFSANTDPLKQCTFAVIEEIFNTHRSATAIETGTWAGVRPDQPFAVTDTGVTFLFGSYELGSYAEGTWVVSVPFAKLPGLREAYKTAPKPSAAVLEGVIWTLEKIQFNDDSELRPEKGGAYDLTFGKDGKLSGTAGRNRIMGNFATTGSGLSVGALVSTKMADAKDSISLRYLTCLGDAKSYMFAEGKLILELPVDTGSLIFRAKN